MLERGAHQLVEQLFQDNCARDRLRQLDHGREVEVFDRRPDRARRTGNSRLIPKLWIYLIELPYLAIRSPAEIAVPGISQIGMRNGFEPPCGVEASGKLIRNRLVVDEAVCASRAHGLLVELLGIERAALDARDLGADERSAVLEVR